MRAVLQRVQRAQVTVSDEVVGLIDQGWLVLLGVAPDDTEKDVAWLAEKIVYLRAFSDPDGKMNLSLLDLGYSLLAVSQFTLYGDCQKGRRPSFIGAARPELAEPLYRRFCEQVRSFGVRVAEGRFGADMQVELVNDGPVTLILESRGAS